MSVDVCTPTLLHETTAESYQRLCYDKNIKHFVGPDLGPNCKLILSGVDKGTETKSQGQHDVYKINYYLADFGLPISRTRTARTNKWWFQTTRIWAAYPEFGPACGSVGNVN